MRDGSDRKLSIIVPAMNEELTLDRAAKILSGIIEQLVSNKKISLDSQILFIDDGSTDKTWETIMELSSKRKHVTGIKFSRNFGHQAALIAGFEASKDADLLVSIDADLQDDPNSIIDMIEKVDSEAVEVVYGVRNDRTTDSFFKRQTASIFYKIMNELGAKTVKNSADFRLMTKKAMNEFLKFPERDMFIRGLVPLVGFKSAQVFYKRSPREAGSTKYPLKKMINFAIDGVTSFSIKPIRFLRNMGIAIIFISMIFFAYSFVEHFLGHTTAGWSSLIISIWGLGGLQLFSIGVLGEYIGQIFTEVKKRPRYIIEQNLLDQR
ncbi:glycosyltransferase family 2 protein [Oenococcus sicerae]|uniref:Glycosyltransferase n=1 Tax=Oenococcus sicerae TaxID=2203724 RepID=A0AAJ1VNM0_9LACO|nr:glycosyltransferase family 2 protein [Oenococcus sicerae]MDN6899964.1 glycosyltransferase [Oenococcus sicerae]QAS69581.1 glycosyltransferase family 2 protein [Oenococcus sicerae]